MRTAKICKGCIIELIHMGEDPLPVEPLTLGIVEDVYPEFQGDTMCKMRWETRSGLNLSIKHDCFICYSPFELEDLKKHAYRKYLNYFSNAHDKVDKPVCYAEFISIEFAEPEIMDKLLGPVGLRFYYELTKAE